MKALLIVSAWAITLLLVFVGTPPDWGASWWAARMTGYLALIHLLCSATVTPIVRALHTKPELAAKVKTHRRLFGLGAAGLSLLHFFFGLSTIGGWEPLWTIPYLRAGVVALAILAVMALTSFKQVLKLTRVRAWKELHRMVYAVLGLALLHILGAPFASTSVVYGLLILIPVLLIARFKLPKLPKLSRK